MKKIFILVFLLNISLLASNLTSQLESSFKNQNIKIDLTKQTLIALNCLKPLKPLLPLKPI